MKMQTHFRRPGLFKLTLLVIFGITIAPALILFLIPRYWLSTLTLVLALLLPVSCTKDVGARPPEANFSIDKETYAPGEAITFTNNSRYGSAYSWKITDATGNPMTTFGTPEFNKKSGTPRISFLASDGWYEIRFTALSNKTYTTSLQAIRFFVTAEYGFIKVRLAGGHRLWSTFFIDGERVAYFESPSPLDPKGPYVSKVFTLRVPIGVHAFRYYETLGAEYKKSLTITKGDTISFN